MKKVLIITYYWPPSGGGGVQRVVKFARYLNQYGWEPLILTVGNGDFPAFDSSFMEDVRALSVFRAGQKLMRKPSQVNSVQKPSLKKRLDWKLKNLIRINFLIPDSKIFRYRSILSKASEILEKEKCDLIFTSSPPYTVQLVGLALKKKYKLPWVVDFRDPWGENVYYNTTYRNPIAAAITKKMEKKVLDSADQLITVGENLKTLLTSKFKKEIHLIQNGYDPFDFPSLSEQPGKLIIGYYGSLNPFQVPDSFLQLLSSVQTAIPGLMEHCLLRLAGNNEPDAIRKIRQVFPAESIEVAGYLEHRQLTAYLCTPQILLQLIHDQKGNHVIVGGKLYEYIHTGNPILCLGNTQSDGSKLVEQTQSGRAFEFEDISGIIGFISHCFKEWKNGTLNKGKRVLSCYEREYQARQLSEVFNRSIQEAHSQ